MHSRHRSFMSCANVGASGFCHPPLRLEFGEHTLPRRRVEIHVKRDTTMISAGWNGMEWTALDWTGLEWTGRCWTCVWCCGRHTAWWYAACWMLLPCAAICATGAPRDMLISLVLLWTFFEHWKLQRLKVFHTYTLWQGLIPGSLAP